MATAHHLLPFIGKARLPTREQTLLLYFAYREVPQNKMKSKEDVAEMVALQVVKYWDMAPIKTVKIRAVITRILRVVDEHDARRNHSYSQTATKHQKL